jgi:hypothetical protein
MRRLLVLVGFMWLTGCTVGPYALQVCVEPPAPHPQVVHVTADVAGQHLEAQMPAQSCVAPAAVRATLP